MDEEYQNPLWGVFWWLVCGWGGGFAAASNFGPGYSAFGTVLCLSLMIAFVLRHPSRSPFKMMMLGAINWACGLGILLGGGFVVVRVGWALLSGEITREGWESMPWSAIGTGMSYALISLFVIFIVEWFVQRDRRRLFEPGVASAKPHPARSANETRREEAREEEPRAERREEPAREAVGTRQPWWAVLDVEPTCSLEEAKAAKNQLLRQYHPDIMRGLPPRLLAETERQTKLINEAWDEAKAALRGAS